MTVLRAIRMRLPTMVRDSMPPSNKALIDCRGRTGVGCSAAGRNGPRRATSASIAARTFSASSVWPLDSSQRGDSGSARRKYQTISVPTPVMTNIQRQPNCGMIRRPANAETNSAELVMADSAEPQRPREFGEGYVTDDDFGAETDAHDKARGDEPADRGRCRSRKRRGAKDQ